MQITKKTYEKPVLRAEHFIPNEYIAVCWSIACELGKDHNCLVDGNYDWSKGGKDSNGATHSQNSDGTGCGWAKNQVITGTNEDYTIKEENIPTVSDTYSCEITNNPGEIKQGTRIEWKTSNGTTTWLHYGLVDLTEQNRPLHS